MSIGAFLGHFGPLSGLKSGVDEVKWVEFAVGNLGPFDQNLSKRIAITNDTIDTFRPVSNFTSENQSRYSLWSVKHRSL